MKNFFILVTLLSFASACSHYYYTPNAQNIPIFHEKGETRLAVSLNNHYQSRAVEAQGAWAAGSNYAFTGGLLHLRGKNGENAGHGTFVEAGAGLFRYKPIKEEEFGWVRELYGGIGYGRIANFYAEDIFDGVGNAITKYGSSKVNLARIQLQPSISFSHPLVDLSFSTRFSYLNYFSGHFEGPIEDLKEHYRLLEARSGYFIVEPAMTLRMGGPNVKVQIQTVVSTGPYELSSPYNFSIGLISKPFAKKNWAKSGLRRKK